MAKRVAWLGMLVALAFVLSYVEAMLPFNFGVPGIKLGLANLVVMVALYTLNASDAWLLSMVRILLVGFTFGNTASLMYSMAGGLLSFFVMLLARKSKRFSITGVSVLGGLFHNVGQILVAMVILETSALIYYLPVLAISGVVTGTLIGLLGGILTKRVSKFLISSK